MKNYTENQGRVSRTDFDPFTDQFVTVAVTHPFLDDATKTAAPAKENVIHLPEKPQAGLDQIAAKTKHRRHG